MGQIRTETLLNIYLGAKMLQNMGQIRTKTSSNEWLAPNMPPIATKTLSNVCLVQKKR